MSEGALTSFAAYCYVKKVGRAEDI